MIGRPTDDARPARAGGGRGRGFTLIEILVALAIFTLLSVAAYRGLNAVLEARARVAADHRQWQTLALLFARLSQDFNTLVNRPVRNSAGLTEPAFVAVPESFGEDQAELVFSRAGFPDAQGPLEATQRVGYRLREGRVELLVWPVLDQGPRTRPQVYVLVEPVEGFRLRYLDGRGEWLDRWPPPGPVAGQFPGQIPGQVQSQAGVFPRAVEAELTLAAGGVLTRLFVTGAV